MHIVRRVGRYSQPRAAVARRIYFCPICGDGYLTIDELNGHVLHCARTVHR
ncbi:hypothetical protein H4R18_003779 [Coemansia javaensis]|uniref:C2H2-type domain-containing protein n=1 Tax=Coemansia javaensis TaxID=2761396 RepID=A0A9W8HCQ6_9FUNG|nr:hypothetical protein H4R18_003779 [Coemansia javaensis]